MIYITTTQARAMGILNTKKKKSKVKPRPIAQWDAKIIPGGIWLQIPDIPPTMNIWKNWHHMKQYLYKQGLYDAMGGLRMAHKLPKTKFAIVTITYYFSTRQRRDIVDNYSPKFIMDSLVNGELLEDDRSDWVSVELVRKYDKVRPRVEIIIRSDIE